MTVPTDSVTNNPWLGLCVIVSYGDEAKINQFNFVNFLVTLTSQSYMHPNHQITLLQSSGRVLWLSSALPLVLLKVKQALSHEVYFFDNLTSARITNLRSIINFYHRRQLVHSMQLQLETLKYENEKLFCENEKLKRVINIKDQLLNENEVKLRNARRLDAKKEVINKDHKFVLKNTFDTTLHSRNY